MSIYNIIYIQVFTYVHLYKYTCTRVCTYVVYTSECVYVHIGKVLAIVVHVHAVCSDTL